MSRTIRLSPLILGLVVVAALVVGGLVGAGTAALSAARDSATSANAVGPLLGGWRMTSLETGEGGDLQKVPYSGQIVFDATGRVAVQAMNPDTAAPDTEFTVEGYEAWAGRTSVDQEAGTFTARVESAVARDMIGTDQARRFTVRGDVLVLTPADSSGGFRATYERY